ncbi:MAG: hypothetical protein HYX88_01665 [Chloroflexi bacterium]|nr:hypothetical protein [Chloroflexota bacterium]
MGRNLLITLLFNKEENRSRLTVMDLEQDGPVPAQEEVQALISAADELKFRMRLAQEQPTLGSRDGPPLPADALQRDAVSGPAAGQEDGQQ